MSFLVNPFRFAADGAGAGTTPVLDQMDTIEVLSLSTAFFSDSLSVGSLPDGLLVATVAGRNSDDNVSGFDWNGAALTQLQRKDNAGDPDTWVDVWYLPGPNAANETLDATFGGDGGLNDGAFSWYFFSGVHQAHRVRVAGSAEGSVGAGSVSYTTMYGNSYLILAAAAQGGDMDGITGLTAGWTVRHDAQHTTTHSDFDLAKLDATAVAPESPGAGTVEWEWNSSDGWVALVLEVVPADV